MEAQYLEWRSQFIRKRTTMGLCLGLVVIGSFSLFNLLGFFPGNSLRRALFLLLNELILIGCLGVIRSSWGSRLTNLIFLVFALSTTLLTQIDAALAGVRSPFFLAWTLCFLAQATLTPVYWQLHLASQVGTFLGYFLINVFVNPQLLIETFGGNDVTRIPGSLIALFLFWVCAIELLSVFLYENLQRREFQAKQELEHQKERTERLLLNILPPSIAERLKLDQKIIADYFNEVTVLFADIVGFTSLSTQLPPEQIVELLNRIFSEFDYLAAEYDLEKIKTIGDAYMVVAGLPNPRSDHAEAIAEMALRMQQAILEINRLYDYPLQIRIGISTGSVVAGVIGIKKFAYDLWGDTVNTASRMESQGIPGSIQVSESTYKLLSPNYDLEPRGKILIKGKGEMKAYLLKSRLHFS